jgi:hypothetical protein
VARSTQTFDAYCSLYLNPVSRKAKFHLSCAVAVLLMALIVNWLLVGESSPFADYFLWHVGLPNMWGALNIIPAIISFVMAGNPHSGNVFVFYFGFCVQWLVVGFILSFVLLLFRFKRDEPTTIAR